MIFKKIAISAAAGAIMLASASGVFASYNPYHNTDGNKTIDSYNTTTNTKTVTVLKADVSNFGMVYNNVVTGANTGGNMVSADGGNASSGGSTSHHHYSYPSGGGSATGGSATNNITTGNAGSSSTVSNVVNTTLIHF